MEPLPKEISDLLDTFDFPNEQRYFYKKYNALKQLKNLGFSHERIVKVVSDVRNTYPDKDMRKRAGEILSEPVHTQFLLQNQIRTENNVADQTQQETTTNYTELLLENIHANMKEQNNTLRSINGKLNFFAILIIIGIIASLLSMC